MPETPPRRRKPVKPKWAIERDRARRAGPETVWLFGLHAVRDALAAAREAAEAGVTIFSVGIGTSEGELIPVPGAQGQRTFLKDRAGRTVKSRLDEPMLKQIALATGGSYVRATATSLGLDVIYRERIAKMEQHEFESTMKKQRELRYQWVLALALFLLWVEPWQSDRTRATV